MKKNKQLTIIMAIIALTLIILFINSFLFPFSDWVIRVDGIVLLLCIAVVPYYSCKSSITN